MDERADLDFDRLVHIATGGHHGPYAWQARVATDGLPELVDVETGAGKTEGIVLPWLWRRRFHPDAAVRAATPRWLVLCLPLRVLTEQVEALVRGWLLNLGLATGAGVDPVLVHVAMGGRPDGAGQAWRLAAERDAVIIGTVDMLLSRALNRGFALSRFAWPIDFGLLHNGAHWVFDEVQLLGPALPTSLQLEGLRRRFGAALPTASTWMSATVDPESMTTVDFAGPATVVALGPDDRRGPLAGRLGATRRIERVNTGNKPAELAQALLAAHAARPRLTVAVMNTVASARALNTEVAKRAPANVAVTLLHSQFRPPDRRRATTEALTPPSGGGRIVISTQVLEAGVDVSATTMLIEAAPWPSVVQRAVRCNRDGKSPGARLLWCEPARALPYATEDVDATVAALAELEGVEVTATDLREHGRQVAVSRPVHQVLRAPDLLGLFDTAPDLSGNDIDVAPFIRVADELDVHIAWRDLAGQPLSPDAPAPQADELCPAPLGKELKQFVSDHKVWRFDHLGGSWVQARPNRDLRPGVVLVADSVSGGYRAGVGWDPTSRAAVPEIPATGPPEEPMGGDPGSFLGRGAWVLLRRHLGDVEAATEALLAAVAPSGLTPAQRRAAAVAGRLHDIGKAHPVFQSTMAHCAREPDRAAVESGGPWAKSGEGRARHGRRFFRHELASALALLGAGAAALDGVDERDLAIYLVGAHHGRVRMAVRSVAEEEREGTVLGVCAGDKLPAVALPHGHGDVPAATLALGPVRLGRSPGGQPSWTEMALGLRDRSDLGPFRLAFLEAVVRLADWRASAAEQQGESDLR